MSALPLQRLRAQSLARELIVHNWFVMALYDIKTSTLKQEIKCKLQTNENCKIRKMLKKKREGDIHTQIKPKESTEGKKKEKD